MTDDELDRLAAADRANGIVGYVHVDGDRFMPPEIFRAWGARRAGTAEAAAWSPVVRPPCRHEHTSPQTNEHGRIRLVCDNCGAVVAQVDPEARGRPSMAAVVLEAVLRVTGPVVIPKVFEMGRPAALEFTDADDDHVRVAAR